MAKRKRSLTPEKIEMRIKEGRSRGDGKDYIPWLKVSDVASKGVSLKTFSKKIGRQHHLLSRLESSFFYIAEWSDNIVDIKEQYALDLEDTKRIANELKIKHPTDPRTKTFVPITTDFLLTEERDGQKRLVARTLKYAKDLSKKRVMQKFDIEKAYWDRKAVDWGIVTEQSINKDLVNNIIWVRKAASLSDIQDLSIETVILIENRIRYEIYSNNLSILEIASKVNNDLSLTTGSVLYAIRFLIANKVWIVDMNKSIILESPIKLNSINLDKLARMRG